MTLRDFMRSAGGPMLPDAAAPVDQADHAPSLPRHGAWRAPLAVKLTVALVGLVVLVLLVNGTVNTWLNYDRARHAALEVQEEKARSAAERVSQFLTEIETQLGWTTGAEWRRAQPDQQRYDFIRLLRQAPAITELSFIDGQGKEQLKVSRLEPDSVGSGKDFSKDPRFVEAVAHKTWFGPVEFRRGSEPYMTIAVAHVGREPGVTVADVNLKLVWDVITAIHVGEKGYAYVVDDKGRLIAHPDLSLVLRDTDMSQLPQVRQALQNKAPNEQGAPIMVATRVGMAEIATSLDGASVLTAYAVAPRTNWIVFVQSPVAEALAPVYRSLLQALALLGLGLLLALVVGSLLARRMVVPIRRLQQGAERLGAGDLSQRLDIRTGDEIETLAVRFNQMAERIKESYETLEAKVEARTADLNEALQQQTATADVLKVISRSAFDLQPVLDTLVESAFKLCGAGLGLIYLRSGDAFECKAVAGAGFAEASALFKGRPIRAGRGTAAERVIMTGEVNCVEDFFADPDFDPKVKEVISTARGSGIAALRSTLAVPMKRDDAVVGVIAIARPQTGPFPARQIELLETFADQAVIAIENVRLFDQVQAKTRDLEESLAQQTATADVLKVISRSAFSLPAVFQTLIDSAVRLCGTNGVIYLRRGDVFEAAAAYGDDGGRMSRRAPRSIDRSSMTGRVALSGSVEQIPDNMADPDFKVPTDQRLPDIRALLGVPLLRNGQVEGVFVLGRPEPGLFADRQIEVVKTFADQAVIAIENVRLFDEVQAKTRDLEESLVQQTATADVLKVISRSAFDLDTVLHTLATSAAHLCNADYGQIFRRDGDVYRWAASQMDNLSPAYLEHEKRAAIRADRGTLIGRVGLERRAVQIADAWNDPEYAEKDAAHLGGVRAMLGVPLLRDGDPIGAFALARSTPIAFSPREVELVTTFADQAVIAMENVRLFDEVQAKSRDLEEALQQQTATADVLKVISRSTFDLKPVLAALVRSASSLCNAPWGTIFLRDGDVFRAQMQVGRSPEFDQHIRDNPLGLDKGSVVGRVALSGSVVQVPDALADPDYRLTKHQELGGYRALLGVPLLRNDAVIGVFALLRPDPREFSQREVELVRTFADQAVIAIENVRLFEDVQAKTRDLEEALQQQTATADVLKVISRSPSDLGPVLDAIAETAARLCGSEMTMFFRFDGQVFRILASWNFPPDVRAMLERRAPAPGHSSALGRAGATLRPVYIPDVLSDPDYGLRSEQERARYRATLAVPMLREGKLVGALSLNRSEPHSFAPKHIELVSTFADQAAIAFENVRLFEEVQARTSDLEESLAQQTATADVLKVISRSAFDLQKVLDTLIGSAVTLSGADNGLIYLQRDDSFYVQAHYNPASEPAFLDKLKSEPQRPGRGSVGARVLLTGEIAHVPDNHLDPDYDPALRAATVSRAVLGVPLKRDGAIVGAIALARREPGLFTDRQIELAQTFADQAVIAIENARLLDQVRARTKELAQTVDDLRSAQDRLIQSEKLASLGQLTAGIAHEIKNPLNFVNNFAALSRELIEELKDIVATTKPDEKTKEEIDEITGMLEGNLAKVVQHGKRADSIVKNMLLHSRESSGEHRPVDLNATVEEALNLAYHGARAEKPGFNIALVKEFDPSVGEVDLYPQEFTRVLLNLISNGFYAAMRRKAEGGDTAFEPMLKASTKNLDDKVEIKIRDNGTGIPPEIKAKMFNPFFTTKPAGEGTGLGLSLSYDIVVKQHGGTIDVDTKPGEFTEFTLVIPRGGAPSNLKAS